MLKAKGKKLKGRAQEAVNNKLMRVNNNDEHLEPLTAPAIECKKTQGYVLYRDIRVFS